MPIDVIPTGETRKDKSGVVIHTFKDDTCIRFYWMNAEERRILERVLAIIHEYQWRAPDA